MTAAAADDAEKVQASNSCSSGRGNLRVDDVGSDDEHLTRGSIFRHSKPTPNKRVQDETSASRCGESVRTRGRPQKGI